MAYNDNVVFKTSTTATIDDLFTWNKSTGQITAKTDNIPIVPGTVYFTSDGHIVHDLAQNNRLWMSKNAYSAIYAEDVAETNTDIANAIKYSIHYVEGPTTDTTPGTWTGTINGITELYDGLTIIYVPAVAGKSPTTTLNINGLGAKTCYYSNTSAMTTHYSVGTPILLTYRNNCWRRADYNSNTTYSAMSVAEMRTGTATSERSIRADYLKTFLSTLGGTNLTLTHSNSAPYLQLNHDPSGITAGTYGNNSQQNPSYGGTFNIPYFTVDTQGHITNASVTTVKIPESDNTDYKVRQTSINSNDNNNYRILLSNSANDTSEDSVSKKNANLIYNPTENKLSTGNIKLTGELDVTGNVYLRNQTAVDSLTAGSLIVNGNSIFNNDINLAQGAVKWTSNSLPSVTSANYFLVIDAFANGGATKYITKADAIKSLISSSAIGSSTKPVYWTGSAFSAITSYSGAAALTGTPTAPTAAAGTNTTQIATTEFVTNAVAQGFVANDAMVFKGLIGSNQPITQLPTSGYNAGWTYRVANAGIFAGEYCEVGDLLIAIKDGPASGSSVINTDWGKIEHNIDGAVFRGSGASNSSVGSSTQPVYVNSSGIVTAITGSLANDITGNAATASTLISNSSLTQTTGLLQFYRGQTNITTADIGDTSGDGKAQVGSNFSYKRWSYPEGGTAISQDGSKANIMNLRLYWTANNNTNYYRDIFMSPNNDKIYTRAVNTTSAGSWRYIVQSSTDGAGDINTPIYITNSGNATAITGAIVNDTTGNAATATQTKFLMNRGGSTVTIQDNIWNHNQTPFNHTNAATVWHQRWKQSGLTYTPLGGDATAITDSGDLVYWLSAENTSNVLFLNMAIDGMIYAGGGFKGDLNGTATNATQLISNNRMDYGWNGINYFNISTSNQSAAKVNDTPFSSNVWTHILRFNHNNASGYYTDLAIPFSQNSIYYKRIAAGSLQNSTTNGGWIKVLDQLNYTSYTVTKTGSGASGTWNINISGNAATATKATQDENGNIITSTYLPLSGGTMTGNLRWNDLTALPSTTTTDYFLTIDTFANGGTTKYITKGNALKSLISSSSIGTSLRPVYWTGSSFSQVNWFPSYCTVDGHNRNNYNYHRIATLSIGGSTWVDRDAVLVIRSRYNTSNYGIVKISGRANNNQGLLDLLAYWLIRSGFEEDSILICRKRETTDTSLGDTQVDVYLKTPIAYPRIYVYMLVGPSHLNGFQLINSEEKDNSVLSYNTSDAENPNVIDINNSDLKGSYEVYIRDKDENGNLLNSFSGYNPNNSNSQTTPTAQSQVYTHIKTALDAGSVSRAKKSSLISTNQNAIAYYTDTTGTFGQKASANGALYATSINGDLQWGTLPISQGGTGNSTFNVNTLIYSETNSKLSSSGHYANSTKIAINKTTVPSENFYVNGTSYFNGNVTHNGFIYFANGTNYYIDNNATANLKRGIFAGTSTGETPVGNYYQTGAIEIRESNRVGTSQTGTAYAPRIGFHWGNHSAASLYYDYDGKFYLRKTNGVDKAILNANLEGNADTATKATQDANGNNIINTYLTKTAGVTNITWDNTNKKLIKTINNSNSDIVTLYAANLKLNNTAVYNTELEIKNIKIGNGSISTSTKNVKLEYNETLETLNFVFS